MSKYLAAISRNKHFIILLFVAVFAYLYTLGARSFWYDEIWVADSILKPTIKEMLSGESYGQPQITPVFFLISIRTLASFLGNSEFILTLVPALLGISSIIICYLLAKKITNNNIVSLAAAFLLAFNPIVLRYSHELKQYMGDIFFVFLLVYIAELYITSDYKIAYLALLTAVSAVAIGFSYTSVFIISAVGVRILLKSLFIKNRKKPLIHLVIYSAVMLFIFSFIYLFYLEPKTEKGLIILWKDWGGFLTPQTSAKIITEMYWLFSYVFEKPVLFIVLFFAGIIRSIFKKKQFLLIYLLIPYILTIIASFLEKYPFSPGRTSLFFTPLWFIYVAIGAYCIVELFTKFKKWADFAFLGAIYILALAACINYISTPNQIEEMKPVVAFYKQYKEPGDYTYVHFNASPQFSYYYGTLKEDRIFILGSIYKDSLNNYQQQIDEIINKIKPARIWIIFAQYNWVGKTRENVVNYIKNKYNLIIYHEDTGASAYLFSC